MMLRSPALAALAVLFISLAVVVVAVDSFGVDTDVYLPGQPTATAVPPTATPVPEGDAAQWLQITPNQYQYAEGDPQNPATIDVIEMPMAEFIANAQFEEPSAAEPFALLDIMEQLRTLLEESADQSGLELGPDAFSAPAIELIGEVPVATLRLTIQPQTTPGGNEFPGGDLFFGWAQRGEDIVRFEYSYTGDPAPQIYRDMRAWLQENISRFVDLEEDDAEAEDDDVEDEGEATDAAADEGEATVQPEAAEDGEADEAAEGTVEPTPEPTIETTTAPTAEPTAVPEAAAIPTDPAPVTMATASGPWQPVAPGAFLHREEPNASVSVAVQDINTLAEQIGYTPEEGEDITIESFLSFEEELVRGDIGDFEGVELIEFEGPANMQVDGVTLSYIEFTLTGENQGAQVGQITFLGLVPVEGEQVSALQFQYAYEGDPDTAIREDFIAWVEANAEALTQPVEQPDTAEPAADGEDDNPAEETAEPSGQE